MTLVFAKAANSPYCADVRTLHPKLHVAATPCAVSAHGAGGDPELPAAVQCLPDRSGGCRCSERRRARARGDALGLGAPLVEQAAQGLRLGSFNSRGEPVANKPF